jgi:hypothetical protein
MTKTYANADEVASRIRELGLTESDLSQAISRGILARSECTPNHPPLHAGFVTWSTTVCALREILMPKGWNRNDEGNYSTVRHPNNNHAIAVATGDENTGNPYANPMTKSPKGSSTKNAIAVNLNQAMLFPELMHILPDETAEGRLTWMLLINVANNKVKAELSLPINCEGKVDGWQERLILPEIDLDPVSDFTSKPILPSLPDIEIQVLRRA